MAKRIVIIALGMAAASAMADPNMLSFNAADANRDGAITRREAASFAALEQAFDSADVNRNGLIERQEFSQAEIPAAKTDSPVR